MIKPEQVKVKRNYVHARGQGNTEHVKYKL